MPARICGWWRTKAGVTAGLEAHIGLDLNDLPNPVNSDPLNPEYDGKVRGTELSTIKEHDAQAVFNTLGELAFILKAFAKLEVLWVDIIDESVTLVHAPIFDFTILDTLTDAQILAGEFRNPPVLGECTSGVLSLYMGPTANNREYSNADRTNGPGVPDYFSNERFDIRSLGWSPGGGEEIEVTFSQNGNPALSIHHRQVFHNVTSIVADGGSNRDEIFVDSSVHADAPSPQSIATSAKSVPGSAAQEAIGTRPANAAVTMFISAGRPRTTPELPPWGRSWQNGPIGRRPMSRVPRD